MEGVHSRMSKWAKFWDKLSAGQSDNNIDYDELETYLERLGWETQSAKTSHRFYRHPLVPSPVNIQPGQGGKAKSYQIAQIRAALDEYLGEDKDGWLRGQSQL